MVPPKDEVIYAFLTDMKHHRDVKRRLHERAEESPEAVMAFIDSLPTNWEINFDETEVSEIFALKKIAMKSIESRKMD